MLAYNLSPSFNWDTTGMSDDEMRQFPEELGKLGFVFNFITYGGHQIDGLAAEEFATALQAGRDAGAGAAAAQVPAASNRPTGRRRPWSAARGCDAALMAVVRADRRDQGDGQGLDAASAPGADRGARRGCSRNGSRCGATPPDPGGRFEVELRPHTRRLRAAGAAHLRNGAGDKLANVIFAPIQDRRGRKILSVRDQNTFDRALRQKRLMTLIHLFLIHRYRAASVHYVAPTDDNQYQTQKMKAHGIFPRSRPRWARSSSPTSTGRASRNCSPRTGRR